MGDRSYPAKPEPWCQDSEFRLTLFHGDSAQIVPCLAQTHQVDLIITDPPFGIGLDYHDHYDDTPEGYAEWLWSILESAESMLAPGGYALVWQAAKHAPRWGQWFPRDFRLIPIIHRAGTPFSVDIQYRTEYVLFWRKDGPKHDGMKFWQPPGARDWFESVQNDIDTRVAREHPCPRPLDAVEYLIRCFCPPGGTVLDLFLGSGTTAVACKRSERRCLGIEIHEPYLQLTSRRLSAVTRPLSLPSIQPILDNPTLPGLTRPA